MRAAAQGNDNDSRENVGAALRSVYPPDAAADAQLDSLIDRLRRQPGATRNSVQPQR